GADGGDHPVVGSCRRHDDQSSVAVRDRRIAYGVPYLRLNTSIIVTYHSEASLSSGLFSEEVSMVYSMVYSMAGYHHMHDIAARDSLVLHVFELVAVVYAHMLVCDQLCMLMANGGCHSTKAQYQMAYLGAIVEAFASAATAESMGATRVGPWHEVQFNEHGRISGAKLAAFGLDRWQDASGSSFATATRRHFCTYLVIAKIGKPTEKLRPGNRGKRDSQMLLLHFLNRVHFEAPMSSLDLEIYHQMKDVIGIHPSLYEYLLMVDADTEVVPDSLTRLVACMVHEAKVIGICGETQLTNEVFSWTTMIQVYEYFISHHMVKAFESLFGSVTCLPGCFCMYCLYTAQGMALVISKNVVKGYSENHVDTLQKKNLLSLGEDRYLTMLMIKYFPQYKITFTANAKCKTTAPDTWSVLLPQRRC
ncbi:hypothetical protein LPJ53_006219, partial [Coemansia erecta]